MFSVSASTSDERHRGRLVSNAEPKSPKRRTSSMGRHRTISPLQLDRRGRGGGISSPKYCPSPGYVLEWSSANTHHSQQHRHILSSIEELRSELLAGEPGTAQGRTLVLRTAQLDYEVVDVLSSVAGVDAEFIHAHLEGRPYRPRAGSRASRRSRWWCWKYPEVARTDGSTRSPGSRAKSPSPLQYKPGDGQILTISRASLWMGADIPILLIGDNHVSTPQHKTTTNTNPSRTTRKTTPKLKHQDAATSQLASAHGSPYGAIGAITASSPSSPLQPSSSRRAETSSFEEDLWETLVLTGSSVDVSIEEIFGELVYDRWVECLAAMRLDVIDCEQEQKSLWRAMASLETNIDEARYLARQGKLLDVVSTAAWTELVQRLELRIHLRQPGIAADVQRRQHHALNIASGNGNDNDRSLDRIAYLGGLLLPITVVASILAIEGDYGPEGGNFWVFWVCSFIASVLAMLVIYADQMRTVEVWFEIGDEADEEYLKMEAEEEANAGIMGTLTAAAAERARKYHVQRWTDGSRGRTWRRQELGWGGAVKKMSGYYWWRNDPRLAFKHPTSFLKTGV